MFTEDYNFEFLVSAKFGLITDETEFIKKENELKTKIVDSKCIDDFCGNSWQSPCWTYIYKLIDNEYFLISNTSYQYNEKQLPAFYYVVSITEDEFYKLKTSEDDFDYDFLKDKENLIYKYLNFENESNNGK